MLVTVEKLNRVFVEESKPRQALVNINFSIAEGEFFVLLGPSGCGKSTLLRNLAGLDIPTSGKVTFQRELKKSFIFQDFALFPWLTVAENIGFGLKMAGLGEAERRHRISEQLKIMELEHAGHLYPRELSGGMKQRVGIARAFVVYPEIVFLDEPFSALDSFTARKLRLELLKLWQKQGVTVVMVTHLIEEAVELGSRIAVMTPGPGSIEMIIENKLSRPRALRSPEFFALVDKLDEAVKV